MTRLNLGKSQPKAYKAIIDMSNEIDNIVTTSGIDAGFAHLLKLYISQLNGCAYCVRLHTHDACKEHESLERINLLHVRHETKYYNEAELVALDLAQAITLIAKDHIPDDIYQKAISILGEQKVVAIEWLSIAMNALNRLGIASRYNVSP